MFSTSLFVNDHTRLDDHEEQLQDHEQRITMNERWRLQAEGALKILAIALGTGVLGYLLTLAGVV